MNHICPKLPILPWSSQTNFKFSVVHGWLVRYAEHFNLMPGIKLGTKVLNINWTGNQWAVKSQKVNTGAVTTEYFDKVCVATGNFFAPK